MPRISYFALGAAPRSLGLPLMKPAMPRQSLAEEGRPPAATGPMREPVASAPAARLRSPTGAETVTEAPWPGPELPSSPPVEAPADPIPGRPSVSRLAPAQPDPACAPIVPDEESGETGEQKMVGREVPPPAHRRTRPLAAGTPVSAPSAETGTPPGPAPIPLPDIPAVKGEAAVAAPAPRAAAAPGATAVAAQVPKAAVAESMAAKVPLRQAPGPSAPAGPPVRGRHIAAREPARLEVRIGTIEIRAAAPPAPAPGPAPRAPAPREEPAPARLTRGYGWVRPTGLR